MAGLQSDRDDTDAFMAGRLTGGLRRLPLLASGGQAGQALRALAGARPQTLAALAAAAPANPEETMGLPPRAPSAVAASDAYPRQSIRDLLGTREPAGFDIFLPADHSPAPAGPAIDARSHQRIDGLLDGRGPASSAGAFAADGARIADNPSDTFAAQLFKRLDQSPTAKAVGGAIAGRLGIEAGVARGVLHTAEGLAGTARFAGRLLNPFDRQMRKETWGSVVHAAGDVADYVQRGAADPQIFVRDAGGVLHQMKRDLIPGASPVAETFAEELKRRFGIGMNQGEFAFNVGTLGGGGALKVSGVLSRVAKPSSVAKFVEMGFSPEKAAHLAELYEGMAHHFVPRRWARAANRISRRLTGMPILPKFFMESRYNLWAPKGISRGDFYQGHFEIDPKFYGAPIKGFGRGEGWSGKELGFVKRDRLGRVWLGAPAPAKELVGTSLAGGSGLGGASYRLENRETEE